MQTPDSIVEQLKREAPTLDCSLPPGLHERIMRKVRETSVHSASPVFHRRRSFQGLRQGIGFGVLGAAALWLVVLVMRPVQPEAPPPYWSQTAKDILPDSLPFEWPDPAPLLALQETLHEAAADPLEQELEYIKSDLKTGANFLMGCLEL